MCISWIKGQNQFKFFYSSLQKQPPKVFYKKDILDSFAKLTGTSVPESLF